MELKLTTWSWNEKAENHVELNLTTWTWKEKAENHVDLYLTMWFSYWNPHQSTWTICFSSSTAESSFEFWRFDDSGRWGWQRRADYFVVGVDPINVTQSIRVVSVWVLRTVSLSCPLFWQPLLYYLTSTSRSTYGTSPLWKNVLILIFCKLFSRWNFIEVWFSNDKQILILKFHTAGTVISNELHMVVAKLMKPTGIWCLLFDSQ